MASLSLSGCLGSESIILANGEAYETPEAYVEKRRGDHSRAKQAITPLDEPLAEKAILILPTDEAIWRRVDSHIDSTVPAPAKPGRPKKGSIFLSAVLDFESFIEHMTYSKRFKEIEVIRAAGAEGTVIPEGGVMMWAQLRDDGEIISHIAAHGDNETVPFKARFFDDPVALPLERFYRELDAFLEDRLNGA